MLQLEAVSRILVSAQQQAVTTLSSPDRMTTKALQILTDVNAREQIRGWGFNSNYDVVLTLAAGNFLVPSAPWQALTITVRPDQSSKDIVQRDGKLYDKTNNTFTFTEPTLKVDIIYLITFDNAPLVYQEFVVADACFRFATEVSVDERIARILAANRADAENRLRAADTQQSFLSNYRRWPMDAIGRRYPNFLGPVSWGRGF